MNLGLTDKIIIVTGGSSGIGAAVAKQLHQEGAVPVILDRKPSELFFTIESELTDAKDCMNAVQATIEKYGRLDGIINNAGINDGIGLEHGNYDDFVRSIHRNVTHYYLLVMEALTYLKESQGFVVNIISKVAMTGQGDTSGYAAANGMRLGFTESWAKELKPFGIRVSGVVVAECFTPGYGAWIEKRPDPQRTLRSIADRVPLGKRMTTPEEIADTVAFLCANGSGQVVHVDGGYVHLDKRAHS